MVQDDEASTAARRVRELGERFLGGLPRAERREEFDRASREAEAGDGLAFPGDTRATALVGEKARTELGHVPDASREREPPARRRGGRHESVPVRGDGPDGVRPREVVAHPREVVRDVTVGRVGVRVTAAGALGQQLLVRVDAVGGREFDCWVPREQDVWRLRGDCRGGVDGVGDAGQAAGRTGRPVVGQQARFGADDAVALDGPADPRVERRVAFERPNGRPNRVERRLRLAPAAGGRRERRLSLGRFLGRTPRSTVNDDVHTPPPAATDKVCRRLAPIISPRCPVGCATMSTGKRHSFRREYRCPRMGYDYEQVEVPEEGQKIQVTDDNALDVPEKPIIPIIHGDGIGKDVGPAAQKVLEAAANATGRDIAWMRVYAGQSARDKYDENLPDDTVEAIKEFNVAIKGPLTTPVGAGFRSLNVALRKTLDLYANVRPTYHLEGVPSPVSEPEKMDMVTFRENTEDVYAGIEWEAGTDEVEEVKEFVEEEMGFDSTIHDGPVGIGVKPITEFGTKRLVREAIDYAIENDRDSVTLVHKGNIMKFTEGAFRDWGYEVADEEYDDSVITEDQLWDEYDGEAPEDTLVVNDRIADNMLQQLLTRTDEYDVIATMNLNGDYMSDAAGAQIGGLGIAPGANFGEARCLAEPVHGSAPKYAGEDKVNPTAMILSGRLMLEYMGWKDAGMLVRDAVEKTISDGDVTYDLERQIEGGNKLATSEFADKVVENIEKLA